MNNMNIIIGFMEFEKIQTKVIRGGKIMYDINGHYKFLDKNGLLDYYLSRLTDKA